MKTAIRKIAGVFGNGGRNRSIETFHSDHYLRHNARRLEHLASLRIPVSGKRVLELGAGIGDHTSYYLDRGCQVTITEANPENIAILGTRYPQQNTIAMDMENPAPIEGGPFDIVHCYGLLYHLKDPQRALEFMGESCVGILFLETCVSFGAEQEVNLTAEHRADPTQSFSGTGCRPTRPWIYAQLQERFPYVYCPVTQPNHEEFPLDWNAPQKHRAPLQRAVFVASKFEIACDLLKPSLLNIQVRQG